MLLLLLLAISPCFSRVVTIFNDRPRLDVEGNYVDAHDGCIVFHAGTFFLYGESYGNLTGTMFRNGGWGKAPQLAVYTSPDLTTWTFRGHLFNSSVPDTSAFTKWIPTAVWSPQCACFVLWFGSGAWSVAMSTNGIDFMLISRSETSRLGGSTDGTGLLLDDDGRGYVAFSALSTGGALKSGHLMSIELLSADLLSSSKQNVTGFFSLDYVESPALFKRLGKYYVTGSSCCCACRGGSGLAIYTATSISGPWTLQSPHSDVNCKNETVPVCGAFGARTVGRDDIVFNAQWWSVNLIPTVGGTAYLLNGRRWLSGAGNNAECDDMCNNGGDFAPCINPDYELRSDFDVWYPLEFDAEGTVLALRPLPNFTLDLADI
jgi:hypothetical protein